MPQSEIPEAFACPVCHQTDVTFYVQTQMWASSHLLVDGQYDLTDNSRWECDDCRSSGGMDKDGPLFDEHGDYPGVSREARKERTVPDDYMGLRSVARALLHRYRKVFTLINRSIMETRINTASSVSDLLKIIIDIKEAVLAAGKDLDAEEFDEPREEPWQRPEETDDKDDGGGGGRMGM